MMEFVMIRLILIAWFLLVVIVLVETDLSEGYHLKQINKTHFAHAAPDRDPIRHHS